MTKKLSILLLSFIFLFAVLLLTQWANAEEDDIDSSSLTWLPANQLTNDSNTPNGAKDPIVAISASGKNVIVAYMHKTGTGDNEADPYYSQSNNYGKFGSWSSPTRIHNSGTDSLFVYPAFDERLDAHAVWLETEREIWYSKQTSWGANAATKIYETPTISGTLDAPIIVASPNNKLDLVWSQRNDTFTEPNIYHARSTNSNAANPSWPAGADDAPLFNTGGSSLQPDAFVDKTGILHIVWQEQSVPGFSINYARFNGATWSTPIEISDSISSGQRNFNSPQIYAQGNEVLVTFEDRIGPTNQNVFFVSCNTNCTNANNWSGNRVTTINYSLNGSDPTFLKPQVARTGSCPIVLFTSVSSAVETQEHIRIGSGCEGWSKNITVDSVDALLGTNKRAIVPSSTTSNGWVIQLAFQLKEGTDEGDVSHIYITRNKPGLYLPVVLK